MNDAVKVSSDLRFRITLARIRGESEFEHDGRRFRLTPCEGHAHLDGYPYVDNCERCAPLWGVIVEEVAT